MKCCLCQTIPSNMAVDFSKQWRMAVPWPATWGGGGKERLCGQLRLAVFVSREDDKPVCQPACGGSVASENGEKEKGSIYFS